MMNQPIYQTPINRRSRAADFRRRARLALTNRWVLAIAVFLLVSVLESVSVIPTLTVRISVPDSGRDPAEVFRTLYHALFSARMLAFYGYVSLFAFLYQIFVGAPLNVGYSRFNLDLLDGRQNTGVNTLFSPFRTCYWKTVGVRTLLILISNAIMLICGVICGVLLAILAVCGYPPASYTPETVAGMEPGGWIALLLVMLACFAVLAAGCVVMIVVMYGYSLCNYILAEYPTLGVLDVLRNSRMLMKGNKWRQFCLHISFIGWMLLAACCTCGLGFLAVAPYLSVADAAFYDEVSGRATAKEVEFPSVNPEDYFQN